VFRVHEGVTGIGHFSHNDTFSRLIFWFELTVRGRPGGAGQTSAAEGSADAALWFKPLGSVTPLFPIIFQH
jgi:hypothetical protein